MMNAYDVAAKYCATGQTEDMTPLKAQLLVDSGGRPTMSVFLDRAKAVYLSVLIEQYDSDTARIAEHLGCSPQNVNKMLTRLERKYGDPANDH